MPQSPSDAPGTLQQVRALLNSVHGPRHARVPADDLAGWCDDAAGWSARMPDIRPPATPAEHAELRALRDDLRDGLGGPALASLDSWLTRHPVVVRGDAAGAIAYRGDGGPVADVLQIVVAAVADGRWPRLKACPDCRHVFYDHSRNRSRTWCAMYAGAEAGRACGSIAKVRTYRRRRAASDG